MHKITKANVCLYYQHVVPPCVHSSGDEHERLLQYAKEATKLPCKWMNTPAIRDIQAVYLYLYLYLPIENCIYDDIV